MNRLNIHPAALLGFLLNVALTAALYIGLQQPEAAEALGGAQMVEAMQKMMPLQWSILAAQAAGLALVAFKQSFGLPVCMIAGALSLPASVIYMAGCAMTHNNIKFAAFDQAGPQFSPPLAAYGFAWAKKLPMLGPIILAAGAAMALLVDLSLGFSTAAAGLFFLYLNSRIKQRPVLALYDDHFTYTGGYFAKTISVPYSAVLSGLLVAQDKVELTVHTASGRAKLAIAPKQAEPLERRPALDALGRMLVHFNVPLNQAGSNA